jgi:hypothetical protein
MKEKVITDKEMLIRLVQAIDYSFLKTDGSYDKSLTYPVIDKVNWIKRSLALEAPERMYE